MRVLMTCRPTTGHILPLVPVGEAAARAGHEVTFASLASARREIEARGFSFAPVGDPPPDIREVLSPPPPLDQQRMAAFTRYFAALEMPSRLRDLEALVARMRPDVIIHENAEVAAPVVAAASEIPLVTMGFGPLLDLNVADAVTQAGAAHWHARGLSLPRWGGMYGRLYLDPCPPSLQVPEIEALPATQGVRIEDALAGPEPSWLRESDLPLAYVTFGTIYNRDAGVFRTCLNAVRQAGLRALVTIGSALDPAQLGASAEGVRLERHVPQRDVLGHCRVVICHGGAGTMLGALAFGVPLVILPQGADQAFNAQRCVQAGVAVALRPDEVSAANVADAVSRVVSDPASRAAAARIARECAAMPDPSAAVSRIEQIVH